VTIDNRDFALRLGMYAELLFSSTNGKSVPIVPSQALQMIGSKTVVYVPVEGDANQFEQRTVVVSDQTPAGSHVLGGVEPGEKVVTLGSFLLRAEALRQYPQ
jgi:multidrug efflux pump subunit AcrA (membrane-fusion protein)